MTTRGLTFGRYELLGRLGWGGFATVHRAWDPLLGRQVALKALLPHLAEEPSIYERFLVEARAIAMLQHPNIVAFYDVGEAEGQPFFTMELVEGPTLAEVLAAGEGLPLPQTLAILRGLCSAVDYIHGAGMIHRDVKAANVMLDPSGRAVLMDFGIVRALDQTQHTRTGMKLGTPEVMSPEQVRGDPVGPESDIYALGILAYQMLGGRPPFEGDTARVLHAHVYDPPPPLRDLRPDLPPAISNATETALAKDPLQRPASAGAFAAALEAAAIGNGQRAAGSGNATAEDAAAPPELEPPSFAKDLPRPDTGVRKATKSRLPLLATSAALALLLVIGLSVLILRAVRAPVRPAASTATTVKLAAMVRDVDVLRSGASTIKRVNIAGAGNDAGTIVLAGQFANADGSRGPYIDLLRSDTSGKWSAVPMADPPALEKLLQKQEGGAFPAVEDLRQLPGSGVHALARIHYDDDTRRLAVLSWDPEKHAATVGTIMVTPKAEITLSAGEPLTLTIVENAYPPPDSGLDPTYAKPTGRLTVTLVWRGDGFETTSTSLAQNCGAGTLEKKAGAAVLLACGDTSRGPNVAARVTDGIIAGGLHLDDLETGDDVTLAFSAAITDVTDPLAALPAAASLAAPAAFDRRQAQELAARATPVPAPLTAIAPAAVSAAPRTAPVSAPAARAQTAAPAAPARSAAPAVQQPAPAPAVAPVTQPTPAPRLAPVQPVVQTPVPRLAPPQVPQQTPVPRLAPVQPR